MLLWLTGPLLVFAKWLAGMRLTRLPWAGQGWHEDTRASLFVGQVRLSVVPRKVRGPNQVSVRGWNEWRR